MIKLGDNWALKSDSYCVTVCRKHIAKTGKLEGQVEYKPTWYYNNYQQALEGIVDRDVQNIDASSLEEICKRIEKIKEFIKDALPEVIKSIEAKELDKLIKGKK